MALVGLADVIARGADAGPALAPDRVVKDSGPQNSCLMPTSFSAGMRSMASSTNGAIRSQSGSRVVKAASGGMPSGFHAAPTGSNRPTSRPPPSSR